MKTLYPRKLGNVTFAIFSSSLKLDPTPKAFSFLIFASVLLLHSSCKQEQGTAASSPSAQTEHVDTVGKQQHEPADSLAEESAALTGVPIVDPGKSFNFDSFAPPKVVPLKGIPEVLSAHPNVRLAGQPKVVPLPAELLVITPGMDSVPMPRTVPVKGLVVPAWQPRPVAAAPLQTKAGAVANIQNLEIDQGIGTDRLGPTLFDSRGYFWIGTTAGVIRYDGKSMTIFSEKEGLSGNMIRAIAEDQRGNLWFATFEGGVTCYDGSQFTHFTEKEGLPTNSIYSMIADSKGNLWFGTLRNGAVRYDGKDFTFFTEKEGLSDASVYSMLEDSKGNLWFGTVSGGVSRFDGQRFTHFTKKDGLCGNLVYSIMEDRAGNIWFGTYEGASRFDGTSFTNFTVNEGLMGNMVMSIYEDDRGIFWFANGSNSAVSSRGLCRFDGQTFQYFTEKEGLGRNTIYSITGDASGNFWLATSSGATRFAPDSFRHFTELNGLKHEQMIGCVTEDERGDRWIGTWGGGLIQFDDENFTYFKYEQGLASNVLNHLIPDQKGNLWMDSGGRGVTYFDGQKFTHYLPVDRYNKLLSPLLLDRKGNLWMGTMGGVIRRDSLGRHVLFDKQEIFAGVPPSVAFEDSRGHLWIGTAGGEAVQYDGQAFTRFTEKEGLNGSEITQIMEDDQGNIWISTDAGLNRYDGAGFIHFSEKEGLSNNSVYSMLEDNTGNIWVGRYHGISKLVPQRNWSGASVDFQTLAVGGYRILNFDTEDGLLGKYYRALFLDRNNNLWAGGDDGLVSINTEHFGQTNGLPKLQIDHVEIAEQFIDFRRLADTAYQNSFPFGKELGHLAETVSPFSNCPADLTLPYDLNHLTFYVSAIDWPVPQKIQYSFLLEGLSNDWSVPQPEPKVDIRNLPSGTHTIKIRAIGSAQAWGEPLEYTFTIRPPWYRSNLAYVCYGVLFLGTLFGIRRYELKRQLAAAEARRMQELDAVKTRLYTNLTHEFRTPLTIIGGLAEQLQSKVNFEVREGLQTIQRNGQQLLVLVNQLLDLAKIESGSLPVHLVQGDVIVFLKYLLESFHSLAEAKDITLQFSSPLASFHMDYDPEKLRQLVSNLLSNALKFTPPGGLVSLETHLATAEKKLLVITVTDNGPGIPPEKLPHVFDRFYQADDSATRRGEGTGIGLTLAQELARLLGGDITAQSAPGKGAAFTVTLPVTQRAGTLPQQLPAIETMAVPKLVGSGASTTATSPDVATILVIEDNPDVVRFVVSLLQKDYRLLTAADGKAGLELAQQELPDLVLSDVMMPEMDGFETCQRLKENLATSHIPVVLLTAKADVQSKIEGLRHGADAYLPKPFHEMELRATLRSLLENRAKLRKFYTSREFLTSGGRPQGRATLNPQDAVFLENLLRMVEDHLDDTELSATGLADLLHVSYITLLRKLQALTGMAITEYIRHIRLHRAGALLLERPDLSISQVALEVGFGNMSYFTREFRKIFGCSASEWRSRKGNGN